MIFHRRVWYRALSLCYACIRSSGIILIPWATFVQNFVSFVASIAELAHGNKSRTQSLTQLIWCPGNQTLNFGTVPLLERHVPEDDADCNLLYTGKRLQHYRLQIMCKKFFKSQPLPNGKSTRPCGQLQWHLCRLLPVAVSWYSGPHISSFRLAFWQCCCRDGCYCCQTTDWHCSTPPLQCDYITSVNHTHADTLSHT